MITKEQNPWWRQRAMKSRANVDELTWETEREILPAEHGDTERIRNKKEKWLVFWGSMDGRKTFDSTAKTFQSFTLPLVLTCEKQNQWPQTASLVTSLIPTWLPVEFTYITLLTKGEHFCSIQVNGIQTGCSGSFSQLPPPHNIVLDAR